MGDILGSGCSGRSQSYRIAGTFDHRGDAQEAVEPAEWRNTALMVSVLWTGGTGSFYARNSIGD